VPKSTVSKLVPKVPRVPAVPGASRRAAYSASTKRALVEVAEELFTAHGYAATPLDAVVAGARVTKGALYHHFSGKQALFEAVFERVEGDASKLIQKALRGQRDPWEKALAGLRAFLGVVQEPRYRRIVIQEGPAVLGYERFREQEERSTFANVLEIVRSVLEAGSWDLDEDMLQTFARIFFGAMSSAGESVSISDDPEAAAARVEAAIAFLLSGVQLMVETGAEPPTGLSGFTGAPAAPSEDPTG
jgi:AcrR family transcriptional regulator